MKNNGSMLTTNNITDNITFNDNLPSSSGFFAAGSTIVIIQLSILSLTIILAIAYSLLIVIKPAFHKNKLNWFTVNVCLASAWLGIIMMVISIPELFNVSNYLSCRIQGFLVATAACVLMNSHCTIAISRLLTIVYAHKRTLRSNIYLWSYIITGWLLAFIVASPYLFLDGFMCFSSEETIFLPYYTIIIALFLPITIITMCNTRTLLFVRNSTRRVHAANTTGQASHRHDILLLKITVSTFITFVVGWTPSFVTQLFNKTASIPYGLNVFFQIVVPSAVLQGVMTLISTNQPVRTFLIELVTRRGRQV